MGSSSVRVGGSIAAAVIGGMILVVALGIWTVVSLSLAVATIVVAALPLVQRVRARRFDLLEPMVGGVVMLAVLFGVRPIAMLIAGDFTYRGIDIAEQFPFTVALGFLGTGSFVVAHEWVRSRQNRQPAHRQDRVIGSRRTYIYVAALGTLSVLLFGLHLSRLGTDLADGLRLFVGGQSPELVARWDGTTEYLSTSPVLAAGAATILGIATRWRMTRFQLLVFAVLIAFPLVVFYLSGARRYMLPCAVVPLATWLLMSGRRPGARLLLATVPLAFLVLATIPFVRWVSTRDGAGGAAAALVQAIGNPVLAVHRFVLGPDTNMVPALAVEVSVLRSPGDFFYGRATIGDLLLAPIPHIIIPQKPQTARDELLTRTFGAPCGLSGDGVCDDFSIIGTFYQDFWLPGVAILMGIVGAATAFLWARWRASPDDERLLVATATWVVFVPIIFRAGFMPGFQWWLYFLVPCLVGVIVMRSRRRTVPQHGTA